MNNIGKDIVILVLSNIADNIVNRLELFKNTT